MPLSVPKTAAVTLMAVMLAMTAAPARSAEATANDTARFLAGLAPSPDSPLAALAQDPLWRQHAHHFDALFAREESAQLSKIRAFSREWLPDKHDTMLYMFSGPDFLYATAFFPSASTYVLSGLEPVGDVPQLTRLPRPAVEWTLQNIESALGSILNFSFFITRNMKTQLNEGPVYGTLPILYVFLARTGKTIREVSLVSLDAEGNLHAANDSDGKKGFRYAASAAKGVRIVFADGQAQRTLYYFSTNLADGSVTRSGFLTFCAKLGPADSFIKSASYLLHTGGFNTVRNFLLDHSDIILQDDSGIPLAYFDPKKWRLQPFGRYVGPLNIFGATYQTRMAQLFRNATPLDFGVGYRWRKNESNLVLAERLAPRTSNGELAPVPAGRPTPAGTDAQPRRKAQVPAASPPARRTRVESTSTDATDCAFAGIFSFCSGWWTPPDQ
jgi:hypothetical protein